MKFALKFSIHKANSMRDFFFLAEKWVFSEKFEDWLDHVPNINALVQIFICLQLDGKKQIKTKYFEDI